MTYQRSFRWPAEFRTYFPPRLIARDVVAPLIDTERVTQRVHVAILHLLVKYLQKHRSSIQKQISRLPLDVYWAYQTWKLSKLSWTLPPSLFNTRLRELHARFLRVTSSDMQGEMWLAYKSLRHWNRSRGSSSQTLFFGGDKRQPQIRLRSQAWIMSAIMSC